MNEEFPPASANSHRSSVSGSEYSYISTEVDTDDPMGNDWRVPSHYSTSESAGSNPSPPTVPGRITGPLSNLHVGESDEARLKRLERE